MKKISLILAAVIAVVSLTVSPYAEEYTEVTLIVDGQEIESDQPAVIVDGRTMVPVRAIAEALDLYVGYNETTKTVVFSNESILVLLTIGNPVVVVEEDNGEGAYEVETDSPAVIINGRTMVSVRFVSEFFSAEVDWNADTKTVTVTSSSVEEESTEPYYIDSELYYVAGLNNLDLNNEGYEVFIFADGELIYEHYSGSTKSGIGKGSYGIYPGETKPRSDVIEHSPYHGMTMEEIIAALETDGYKIINGDFEKGVEIYSYQRLQ